VLYLLLVLGREQVLVLARARALVRARVLGQLQAQGLACWRWALVRHCRRRRKR
jgi:hypothetical protein